MEEGRTRLSEPHPVISFGDHMHASSPFFYAFPVWRVDRGAFLLMMCMRSILCAVALTGCARGVHTHPLASYTSSCDPPLFFVYFQVNTGVLTGLS